MPTVAVSRDTLFAGLGKTYTDDEFDELCFKFGIELDDVMTEEVALEKRSTGTGGAEATLGSGGSSSASRVLYYIAVPANRYDLLCVEGLTRALNIYLQHIPVPNYVSFLPPSPIRMTVQASTFPLRPFIVCAVLRGVTFTPESYASFIDLQDKLHQNICRRRTLVAIGTHDLSTLTPPFTYSAAAPQDIHFTPLTSKVAFRGDALIQHYLTDPTVKHIKPYVDIISGSPVYPVIRDAQGTVLSLPPLINGEHSKITLGTRDIFIEATATDLSKAHTVLNTITTMFSQYTTPAPFAVEQVEVVYETPVTAFIGGPRGGGQAVARQVTPDLSPRAATVSPTTVRSLIGVPALPTPLAAELLSRMGLSARMVEGGELAAAQAAAGEITATPLLDATTGLALAPPESPLIAVSIPPTRSDVLHECDIAEDVAIAYGYNNIARTLPPTPTVGGQLPVNALTDHLRKELAAAGCEECLTLALCSREENYGAMLLPEDGKAVVLANPQSEEFQIGRTSVAPGLLKSLACNRATSVKEGLKLFEVTDVMLLDASSDVGARNERHLAVLYTGPTAGLEVLHGLLDRVMLLLEVPVRPYAWCEGGGGGGAGQGAEAAAGEGAASSTTTAPGFGKYGMRYSVEPLEGIPTYFPGRGAQVVVERPNGGKPVVIGTMGVLHPTVLKNFDLTYPASILEINIEPFVAL